MIERLVGVYDAEGSLRGELAYALGKLAGRAHCALCDITHGVIRPRRSFETWRDSLPVPFELVHLDERSDDIVAASTGRVPCVVARTASGVTLLLAPDDLEACAGDVERMAEAIARAVDAHDLTWPNATP